MPEDRPIERTALLARAWLPRLLPLALVLTGTATILALGLHHELTLDALVRHREALDAFVVANGRTALLSYIGAYIVAVSLSIPCSVILTIAGGLMFGTVPGAFAAITGSALGSVVIFLVARSALGGWLIARAGQRIARLARGFRRDAFSYVLFLRLVPIVPFWLVNLVSAIGGIALAPFIAATAIGIMPAAFVFAFFGAGLDSALAGQVAVYRDCLAAGGPACKLHFDLGAAVTPKLIAAFVALGVLALLPVIAKHVYAARRRVRKEQHG